MDGETEGMVPRSRQVKQNKVFGTKIDKHVTQKLSQVGNIYILVMRRWNLHLSDWCCTTNLPIILSMSA